MSDLQDKLLWLCSTPSVTGNERLLADELSQRFAALPNALGVRRHEDSLVIPLTQGVSGPTVLLVAELDTTDAGQPAIPTVDGNNLLGAGAAEAKSGLALLLALAERGPTIGGNVSLVLHARGEAGFDGSELGVVLAREPELLGSDFALVMKPTQNKLQLGCAGSTQATLAFVGRAGHSAVRGAGVNAIHRFARVLADVANFEPRPDVVDGLTWYELLNVTAARGGSPGTVIPSELEVHLHHTFGPSSDCEASQDKLMALVDGKGAVRFEELSEAAAPCSHPLMMRLAESGVVGVDAHPTWSEVSRFTKLGVAAANFGPGIPSVAHSRSEFCELAGLDTAYEILSNFVGSLGR